MTVEEYQTYFDFCSNMWKTPYSYIFIKRASFKTIIWMTKENLNKYDLKYIEFMNLKNEEDKAQNKYFLKKYWDVKLKIK